MNADEREAERKKRNLKYVIDLKIVLDNFEKVLTADHKRKIPEVRFQLILGQYLNYLTLAGGVITTTLLTS